MKICVVGAGGVGGWFISELAKQIENCQIEFTEQISIADGDIIELEQLEYQNFLKDEVGLNKAITLSQRYNRVLGVDIFRAIPKRIEKESQLKGYDLIILCVDNDPTRKMIIEYCHKHGKEFLDLRATGRKIFAMPKLRTLEENLKFVDGADLKEYSCQSSKRWLDIGNKVVAMVGVQMFLNYQRCMSNRVIVLTI